MTDLAAAPAPSTASPTDAGPVWFHRVNPFTRARLADAHLTGAVAAVLAAETEVARSADAAGAALHVLVGEATAPEARKALLATSRALRRGKQLPAGEHPAEVEAWQAAVTRRDAALATLRADHDDALARERRELARQLADPDLRASLELVAPEVAKQAGRYVDAVGPTGRAASRVLKSERGLVQYVMRAAVRTSPLSRLTAIGLTHAEPGGAHPDHPVVLGERSVCSLDRVMLDHVVGGALERDGVLGGDPHIGIPPTGATDGERLYVLRPTAEGWQRVGVPLAPPLRQLVEAVAMGPAPLSAVVDHLVATVGTDHADDALRTRLEQFVRTAVERGLVCTLAPSTDADLADLTPRGSTLLAEHLPGVAADLAALGEAPAHERRAVLDRLDTSLGDLSRAAGRPARIGVTEDRFVELAPVDDAHWRPALDDLGPAVDLLATFDWLADVAVALGEAFVARHGAGATVRLVDDAPALVAAVTEAAERMTRVYAEAADDPSVLDTIGGADSTLARLYAVRRGVEDAVGAAVDDALARGLDEVVLTHADVDRLLAGMPERLRERPLGYGVLVQSLGGRLVVNDGLPGHGMLFSRFLGPDRALGGHTLARLRAGLEARYAEPGTTLVEDRSHHGMNVNVHPPVLDDVLEPQDWQRLELRHDAASDRLEVLDGERRLKVLPVGGGHPGLYPPPLSVASGLVIAGRLYNGLPDAWAERDGRDRTTTRRVPRVLVGDVVVSRARWYPGEDLAAALAEPDEADRVLAVARWCAAHGVPREVVVKSVPADTGPASVGSPEAQAVRFRSKPQYVDLGSALCVRVLPRMLERRGGEDAPALYLEEAAPGVVDGTHAAEWVLEVSRPAGGRFSHGGEG
ncbi:lantibiotic dehydratase family protein [Phycicoccus jejuensis]|uniref:hypothetical protein n=1 Tax=Phycicoccus jejuensis TaxID=367299 RepID=UPI00384A852C